MYSDFADPGLNRRDAPEITLQQLERVASLAMAGGLLLYGLSRRSATGLGLAVAAVPLIYRGALGQWPTVTSSDTDDTRAQLAGDRGVVVHEAVRLELPLDEVYAFWRRFENLPRFMTHLASVTETDERRSHWTARGPGGVLVEWDAEIINEVENQVIGWQSLPGGDITVAGSVNFDAIRGGHGTQVTVRLQYAAPAGRIGSFVSMLAGREPSQTIREDLRRLKQILEAGEVAYAPSSGSMA